MLSLRSDEENSSPEQLNAAWSLAAARHYPDPQQTEGSNDKPCHSQREKPLRKDHGDARVYGGGRWVD